MAQDAGDRARQHSESVELESDGTGSAGNVVKYSGGQVTPTTANGDALYGVLGEDSPSAGEHVLVEIHGSVNVVADGSITEGDLLQASDSTNGQVVSAAANEGTVTAVDEGGTDTYNIYTKYMIALEDATDGDTFEAFLS